MKSKKGFTLIELMIVVAILGILAAVAIPKFADLIRKSKEGATKGSLGTVKSALSIYYGALEGAQYPTFAGLTATPFIGSFLEAMPVCKLGANHADSSAVVSAFADGVGWYYAGSASGTFYVDCTHTDTKGSEISSW